MSGAPLHSQDETTTDASVAGPPALPAEAHQFDFWLGDWDLTWEGGGRGRNRISRILDGQVIQEQFSGSTARLDDRQLLGLSVSVYVPALGAWRQTWVDSSGNYLDFIGTYADGKLTLSMERAVNGRPAKYRMVFYNIATDTLDWNWERSEDGGQSWELLWRIHYQRRTATRGDSGGSVPAA
jgi:hypothetical protein